MLSGILVLYLHTGQLKCLIRYTMLNPELKPLSCNVEVEGRTCRPLCPTPYRLVYRSPCSPSICANPYRKRGLL